MTVFFILQNVLLMLAFRLIDKNIFVSSIFLFLSVLLANFWMYVEGGYGILGLFITLLVELTLYYLVVIMVRRFKHPVTLYLIVLGWLTISLFLNNYTFSNSMFTRDYISYDILMGLFHIGGISLIYYPLATAFFLGLCYYNKAGLFIVIGLFVLGNSLLTYKNSTVHPYQGLDREFCVFADPANLPVDRVSIMINDSKRSNCSLMIYPELFLDGIEMHKDTLISLKLERLMNSLTVGRVILVGAEVRLASGKYINGVIRVVKGNADLIYVKKKFVPFSEKPLFGLLSGNTLYDFSKRATSSPETSDFDESTMAICYDIVDLFSFDSNIIIHVTKEDYFGGSYLQFLYQRYTSYVALSNEAFIIRSSNGGVSGLYNKDGELVKPKVQIGRVMRY